MGRKRIQKRNEGPQSANLRTLTGVGHGRQTRAQSRAKQRRAADQENQQDSGRNLRRTHEQQVTAEIHEEPRAQPGQNHPLVELEVGPTPQVETSQAPAPVPGQQLQPGPLPGVQQLPVQQERTQILR